MRQQFAFYLVAGWFAFLAIPGIVIFGNSLSLKASQAQDPHGKGFNATSNANCAPTQRQSPNGMTFGSGRDEYGRFPVRVCINRWVASLGVTDKEPKSIITWEQAVEFRLSPNRLNFDQSYTSGAKTFRVARALVASMQIGDIVLTNFEVLVGREHELRKGILGRDFLSALKSHKIVEPNWLIMMPH